MNDVVVGVDESVTAGRAAVTAAELAAALGTNLHVVMCVERSSVVNVQVGADQFHSDYLSDADQKLTDMVRTLPCESTTTSVKTGDPAKSLCDEAARLDARAIVVGNRRVQGLARVLGSVASEVIKHAPCDVVVANTTGD